MAAAAGRGFRLSRVAALLVGVVGAFFAVNGWLQCISTSVRLPLFHVASDADSSNSSALGDASSSSASSPSFEVDRGSSRAVGGASDQDPLARGMEGWSVQPRTAVRRAPLPADGAVMCTAVRPLRAPSFLERKCGCEWNCPLLPSGNVDLDRWGDAFRAAGRIKRTESKKLLFVRSRNDEVLGPATMIPFSAAFFPPQRPQGGDTTTTHSSSFSGRWVNPWSCVAKHVHDDTAARQSMSLVDDDGVRHVLFLGHSHVRVLAAMLCMMLNLTHCHAFRRKLSTTRLVDYHSVRDDFLTIGAAPAHARKEDVRLANLSFGVSFVKSLYDLRRRLHAVDRFNFSGDPAPAGVVVAPADTDDRAAVATVRRPSTFGSVAPSLVVYARGLWDLAYMDTPMDVLYHEVSSGLVDLLRRLPRSTRVVLYLPHYTQPIRKTRSRWQFSLRNRCLNAVRLQRLRSVLLCALRRVVDRYPDFASRIGLFDVWHETDRRELRPFVDYGGHHYHDIVLEAFVMKLLRQHVCPLSTEGGSRESLVKIALSGLNVTFCEAVSLGRDMPPLEDGCACHNYTLPVDAACRLLKSDRHKRR